MAIERMNDAPEILIVDDEPNTLASLSRAFRLAHFEATVCDNAARALELATSKPFDLILTDVVMPGRDGLALLDDLMKANVHTPVVLMSGQADIQMAVRAMIRGAVDFLEKPISSDRLIMTARNAMKLRDLERENQQLRGRVGPQEFVGESPAMKRICEQLKRVAGSETRVCIYGETGTGKELAARTLHSYSPRLSGPFVSVNCAAVPSELIESELFGHEKGAFTGALSRHVGKFEQAHKGTLLLDEIGDMPLAMQAKLLRVLEQGEIERVGGQKPVRVDVRVLVATHRNLKQLAKEGSFREDLYHRVVVFPITLPPLRERSEDIPLLVEHFAKQVCRQNGWRAVPFTPEAIAELREYPWPGNVRELRNIVERLLLLATEGVVNAATVELALPKGGALDDDAIAAGRLAERVEKFEREQIVAELQRNQHNVSGTARALGLERSHFYKKCQQLGIDLQHEREQS